MAAPSIDLASNRSIRTDSVAFSLWGTMTESVGGAIGLGGRTAAGCLRAQRTLPRPSELLTTGQPAPSFGELPPESCREMLNQTTLSSLR